MKDISLLSVRQRATAAIIAVAFAVAIVLPVIIGTSSVSALPFTERKITIGSSEAGRDDTIYTANFKPGTTGAVLGFVIEFCSNSPLIGQTCTAPAALDTNEATITVTGWTVHANTDANTLIITRGAGTYTAGVAETITLGTGAANNGIDNPSATGSYYARLLSYTTAAGAQGYTDTAPNSPVDSGGVALSTANQLTITAQVQEQLTFCVGTINGAAPADCTGLTGTAVNLGTISAGAASITPVVTGSGGNNVNGAAMVSTNAGFGVVVTYYAEQGAGTNHQGALRVSGATCNAGSIQTDPCFRSPASQTAFDGASPAENFGLTVSTIDTSSGTTTNLVRNANYDGDGTSAQGFAWREDGLTDTLASSAAGAQPENRVTDEEMLLLRFAARSASTTPTGIYTVVSTYIATSTY